MKRFIVGASRSQSTLFPEYLEDWVGDDNPVRVTNLRMDPFENVIGNMDHMPMYFRWAADKLWIYQPMQTFVGRFLQSFQKFPQRQKSASFNVGAIMERMQAASAVGR